MKTQRPRSTAKSLALVLVLLGVAAGCGNAEDPSDARSSTTSNLSKERLPAPPPGGAANALPRECKSYESWKILAWDACQAKGLDLTDAKAGAPCTLPPSGSTSPDDKDDGNTAPGTQPNKGDGKGDGTTPDIDPKIDPEIDPKKEGAPKSSGDEFEKGAPPNGGGSVEQPKKEGDGTPVAEAGFDSFEFTCGKPSAGAPNGPGTK